MNKSALAREKIRRHILKHGSQDFALSESLAFYWFHAINRAVFNRELPGMDNARRLL